MKKIKVAIIGVGSISNEHIKGYLADSNVELYAFCDINEERLKMMGEKYGITRLYTDEAEMLKALPELDAVSVCTWNSAHAPCTIMALNAGKHVLCEKPMAMNAKQAEEMLEAAKRNGKLLMIGFVRRFGRDCDIVSEMTKNDRLGEVYYAKASYLRRNGHPGGWFGDKSRSGGGPLIDLGVHVIDLVRYLLDKPLATSVYGATFQKLGDRSNIKVAKAYVSAGAGEGKTICDCEDLAVATIRFDNGTVLSVEASFSLNMGKEDCSVQLFGTKGGVKIGDSVELYNETDGYLSNVTLEGKTGFHGGAFAEETAHFANCIINGTPCRTPAEDGVELMRILDAIYRSAESGHEESIAR